MDFDLSAAQLAVLSVVDEITEQTGGLEQAFQISVGAGYSVELDEALEASDLLRGASLLDRVLVTERLAELGTATTFGLKSVVALDADLPTGGLAVVDGARTGPVRYAAAAANIAVIRDGAVHVGPRVGDEVTEVRSGFGYPYALVNRAALGGTQIEQSAESWATRLTLAISAEIAGNATRAVARTAEHLRDRTQFGRPLSTFQALRHRLAEAAVSAESTRWLVRYAAYTGERSDIDIAAAYAAETAAQLVPELVQMCGARSFALEFGLHVHTMRLGGLRLELGSGDRLATAALAH